MRIISVVCSMENCTAYLKDGSVVRYPIDAEETEVLFKAIPEISLKGYADVDLIKNPKNVVEDLEEVLQLKMFSCFKDMVERLEADPKILEDLKKIQSKYFNLSSSNETIVGVKDGKAIAGLERLNPYIRQAVKLKQYKGLKALLDRLYKMNSKKNHKVEDLLDFLEKADLPIADDGSIIAYKMVNKKNDYFVDCHSGKVKQDVRYKVFMDPSMVDPDRDNECSQGLHIARRGYLKSFYGDACLLVKFNPEDVIAVPHEDPNKIRVCAYEILAVLPESCSKLVQADQPMTSNPEGKKLLAKAIGCKFPSANLYTEITGEHGTGCKYGELDTKGNPVEEREVSPQEATALDEVKVDKKACKAKVNEAKLIQKAVEKAKKCPHPMATLNKLLPKGKLTKEEYFYADALRKRLKKSWKALGFSEPKH